MLGNYRVKVYWIAIAGNPRILGDAIRSQRYFTGKPVMRPNVRYLTSERHSVSCCPIRNSGFHLVPIASLHLGHTYPCWPQEMDGGSSSDPARQTRERLPIRDAPC